MSQTYTVEKVSATSPLRSKVQKLFIESFPITERVSLDPFYKHPNGPLALYALIDKKDGELVAFFCTLKKQGLFYLFYIAVDVSKRGIGIGSDIINVIKEESSGDTIFLDCEAIYPGCTHRAERIKRIRFYEKNGFKAVGPHHNWREEKFQTMVYGGDISREDIKDFWNEFGHLWDEPDVAI